MFSKERQKGDESEQEGRWEELGGQEWRVQSEYNVWKQLFPIKEKRDFDNFIHLYNAFLSFLPYLSSGGIILFLSSCHVLFFNYLFIWCVSVWDREKERVRLSLIRISCLNRGRRFLTGVNASTSGYNTEENDTTFPQQPLTTNSPSKKTVIKCDLPFMIKCWGGLS